MTVVTISFLSSLLLLAACAGFLRIAYLLRGGLLGAAWLCVGFAVAAAFMGPLIPEFSQWADATVAVLLVVAMITMSVAVAKLHPKK